MFLMEEIKARHYSPEVLSTLDALPCGVKPLVSTAEVGAMIGGRGEDYVRALVFQGAFKIDRPRGDVRKNFNVYLLSVLDYLESTKSTGENLK